ncbi:MAG TPA: hypothetical protein PKA06_05310, partial [Gemmatales bacterium]|nr:hypothetical protein [Gemmatales bacterium]
MPAPDKSKKPKKLDKGKKGEPAKKKGSSNMLIILSVVGVLVLLAVGITLFLVMSNDEPKKPAVNVALKNTGGGEAGSGDDASNTGEAGAVAFNLNETLTKVNDLTDKLADAAQSEEAAKQLREILESDAVSKARARDSILNAIVAKAKDGNAGARQFMQKLSRDTTNSTLAQAALRLYNENLRAEGETEVAVETGATEEPTNYLPNKVDVVFSLSMSRFLDSQYKQGVFNMGAFRLEDIERRCGLPANTIEQFIVGGMKDYNQVVAVIRTTSSFNWDDFKKAVSLEENGQNVKGKTYHLGKIDFMSEFLGKRIPGIEALRD